MSSYYGSEEVKAIINLNVETKDVDTIARKISEYDEIMDVYLVTGDIDIIAKAKFKNYDELKKFVVEKLATISGIKDTITMMVVTTYKESGEKAEKKE
ncbi:MAG: Lrp/AsnC family transcriptional regulator [Thermoplasmata archaeon]|nr:MAG: Lrp/AsnC family transcriptional regulator [Thermoplasmata archaeon]